MERYHLRDRHFKTPSTATFSSSVLGGTPGLGPEDIEGRWQAGQVAGYAAVFPTEDVPFACEIESGTPEMEYLRPILAQRPISPPRTRGLANIIDKSFPESTQSNRR